MDSILRDAFDSEWFRSEGHRLIDMLADYLNKQQSGDGTNAIPWRSPKQLSMEWDDRADFHSLVELAQYVIDSSVSLQHPNYMGHQIGPSAVTASLAGLIVDVLNNGMGVYEMGMAGTILEQKLVQRLAEAFGLPNSSGGFFTSGGSLANLTAILAARSAKVPTAWDNGSGGQTAFIVSDESHYCIDRSVRIMGWGRAGVVRATTDNTFRMKVESMRQVYAEATSAGTTIIGVVANAGSTSTGSFDDLRSIGEFCRENDLWFHVDGAHGAAVAFSNKHRNLVDGIELADSIVIDFHKMLLTPAICSAVLFRDRKRSHEIFTQQADYLWESDDSNDSFDLARRTVECTKSMMVLKVYALLALHGEQLFERHVDSVHELANRFADMIKDRDRFELAVEPSTNIVCFRYHPRKLADGQNLSELNARIRKQIVQAGEFYIVQTALRGETWLRTTLANPITSDKQLARLLDRIEQVAKD